VYTPVFTFLIAETKSTVGREHLFQAVDIFFAPADLWEIIYFLIITIFDIAVGK